MSLRAPLFSVIPEQTEQIARAAFPKGNPYMAMRDAMGPIYYNPDFAHLFPKTGQPAEAPANLALATVMQFASVSAKRSATPSMFSQRLHQTGSPRGYRMTGSTPTVAPSVTTGCPKARKPAMHWRPRSAPMGGRC
jgi:hypothetical protein